MRSLILVHPEFDRTWPHAADHFHALWRTQGPVELLRLPESGAPALAALVSQPKTVERLATFCVPVDSVSLVPFESLREICALTRYGSALNAEDEAALQHRGVSVIKHRSEGFWSESVSEFGLALTLCGLRRIPQLHSAIRENHESWSYVPAAGTGGPGLRGAQFGDDARFASGTIARKRVRVIGAGNIASRYAAACHFLGADVAAWDPYASEPCFHRAGARREHHLTRLVADAEIFVPMVPLTDQTRGIVTGELIRTLPRGCLVVLVTRAKICDMAVIRTRVLADELSLAADVFDVEPVPLADPLLGRHNVVHTPHNAGRTLHANHRLAEMLVEQFRPTAIL